jgi:hypothetical protein
MRKGLKVCLFVKDVIGFILTNPNLQPDIPALDTYYDKL